MLQGAPIIDDLFCDKPLDETLNSKQPRPICPKLAPGPRHNELKAGTSLRSLGFRAHGHCPLMLTFVRYQLSKAYP